MPVEVYDAFRGFPKEGLEFLRMLGENNEKAWFEARRPVFEERLMRPAQSFVVELGRRLREVSPKLRFDPAVNGTGSMTRIYRDIRFSKDKSPYKDWLGFRFWEGAGRKAELPGFFFVLQGRRGAFYGGWHSFPRPAVLEVWRRAVDDPRSGPRIEAQIAALEAEGLELHGEQFKRVPRGHDRDHPRARLLRLRGLLCHLLELGTVELRSPGLPARCAAAARRAGDLHREMVRLAERAGRA